MILQRIRIIAGDAGFLILLFLGLALGFLFFTLLLFLTFAPLHLLRLFSCHLSCFLFYPSDSFLIEPFHLTVQCFIPSLLLLLICLFFSTISAFCTLINPTIFRNWASPSLSVPSLSGSLHPVQDPSSTPLLLPLCISLSLSSFSLCLSSTYLCFPLIPANWAVPLCCASFSISSFSLSLSPPLVLRCKSPPPQPI